jgi:hypothetical protein
MGSINVKDLAFKTLWTAIAAGLAYLGAEALELEAGWAPIATSVITFLSAAVRQQLGATPPDAPKVGPLSGG